MTKHPTPTVQSRRLPISYSMNYTTADLDRWLTRGLGDRPYRRAVVRHDQAAGPADVRGLSPWSAVTINARVAERDNNGHGLRAVRDEAELSQHHESVPIPAEVLARCPRMWRELVPSCRSAVSSRLPRRRRCASLSKSPGGRTRRLGRKSAPSSTASRETPQSMRPPRPSRLDDPSGGLGCPAQFPGTRPMSAPRGGRDRAR